MGTPRPEKEAREILYRIDKYFPKVFEAKESIKWLHKHTSKGKQSEWQAFFFEEYCRELLTAFLGGWHGARIIKSSRIDYQRYYNWDLKVHSISDKHGNLQHSIPLNDKSSIDRIIKTEFGLGFIVAYVKFTFDKNGILQKWRDQYEGRTVSHSSRHHMMKNKGSMIDLKAIFINDKKVLNEGLRKGWMNIFNQGRQPTGASRKPKYMINLDKIPEELFIKLE
jgi:hypothetical protein